MRSLQLIDRLQEKLRTRLAAHLRRWLPPAYIKSPVYVTFAYDVSDPVVLTMERILGICFEHGGRGTPDLVPDDMAALLGRPKSTLYRHLEVLSELKWIEWEQVPGRRIRIRPLVFAVEPEQDAATPPTVLPVSVAEPADSELLQALIAAGIEYPYRDRLAADPRLDAEQVRAWHLWTQHPDRANLVTPTGVIVRRLEDHVPPPEEYVALARLSEEEVRKFKYARWDGGLSLPEYLQRLYPLYHEIYGDSPAEDYSAHVVT